MRATIVRIRDQSCPASYPLPALALLLGGALAQRPATAASATFAHPGVTVSRGQLDFARDRVPAGAQSWKGAWDQMMASKHADPNRAPKPRAVVGCGSYSDLDHGCTDEREDAIAVVAAALLNTVDLGLANGMLLFLAIVVAAALLGGLFPALASAAFGSLLPNYFYTPPLHRFTIADPKDIVAIAIFIGIGLSVASVVGLAGAGPIRLPGCGGAGRPVGRKRLLQEVWGPSYGTETNCLRVYTARLRRKPEADPSHPKHFVTEPGTATASRSGGGAGPGEEGRVSDLPPGGATGLSVTPGTLQT